MVAPCDAAAIKGTQTGLGNFHCLPDAGLARVAVQIGGDQQARARHRVNIAHHRPFAAGQHPARRVPFAAQTDAVGIGQRRHFAQRQAVSGFATAQALGLGADAVDGASIGLIWPFCVKTLQIGQRFDPQGQINRCPAQRVAFGQQRRQQRCLIPRFGHHMRQTRVQGQGGQGAAMIGDPPARVQRAQLG